jgi:hypothetical protein
MFFGKKQVHTENTENAERALKYFSRALYSTVRDYLKKTASLKAGVPRVLSKAVKLANLKVGAPRRSQAFPESILRSRRVLREKPFFSFCTQKHDTIFIARTV